MAGLLALGFVLVYVVDRHGARVSQDEAVAIARTRIDFAPEDYQIRFLRRGIPSRGYWAVSFFIRKQAGGYERVTVVLVDAASGKVTEVRRET
jgi:hypothetical protein